MAGADPLAAARAVDRANTDDKPKHPPAQVSGANITAAVTERIQRWRALGGSPTQTFQRECEVQRLVDAHADEANAPYEKRLLARTFASLAARCLDTVPTVELLVDGLQQLTIMAQSITGQRLLPVAGEELDKLLREVEERVRAEYAKEEDAPDVTAKT